MGGGKDGAQTKSSSQLFMTCHETSQSDNKQEADQIFFLILNNSITNLNEVWKCKAEFSI